MPRKLVTYKVDVVVDDQGEFDPTLVRKAIIDGLRDAKAKKNLTHYTDKTTEIKEWSIGQGEVTDA